MGTPTTGPAPALHDSFGGESGLEFLPRLSARAREQLLDAAIRTTVPAGTLVYRDGEPPRIFVVVTGLLRVFLSSTGGRQVTVRYVHSGEVAGLALVVGGPGPMSIQAMTSSSLVALRTDTLRSLLVSEPGVARVCAEELTRQLYQVMDDLSGQAFLPIRQRIVLQLLNLAAPGDGANLVVRASHEELAETVATAREVVSRILRRLRDEGLIATSRTKVTLLDPIALAREVTDRRPAPP